MISDLDDLFGNCSMDSHDIGNLDETNGCLSNGIGLM